MRARLKGVFTIKTVVRAVAACGVDILLIIGVATEERLWKAYRDSTEHLYTSVRYLWNTCGQVDRNPESTALATPSISS